ncbi:hypothetical protein FPSM_02100 [Flavobacterium psychrophilum]|nr:hypothetical protein FPSM_02100 [Flavobacterium psychrophilum]
MESFCSWLVFFLDTKERPTEAPFVALKKTGLQKTWNV